MNNSYQQNLDKNTRTGFVVLMVIVTALLSLMTIFALFYQVHQKGKAPVEEQVNDTVPKDRSGLPEDEISPFMHPSAQGSARIKEEIFRAKRREGL